ncbi:MAG: type II toxin-antitoxin system PemK/MazF family toxin [Clostridiales Family XIII bacterium]|jgi:mRNA interferase MazF|nr:type II toxin-antitoxin system PemK/MazF family toxin [Clostridiales Family XIII bacterium]
MNNHILRGDIYYADLNPVVGSEQGGIRPVLIIQNDVGNRHSPTVIVAAITSRAMKTTLPTHCVLGAANGLGRDSLVLLEQIRTIDKQRLKDCVGALGQEVMQGVDRALAVSVGLDGGR